MIGSETIESYLGRLASREPTPGGGAAGALHAAQGAALVAMVARYSTGPKYAEFEADAAEVIERADNLTTASLSLADDDEAAFATVIAAYQLPRQGDGAARTDAIQSALVAATAPPRDLVANSEAIVILGERLVEFCNPHVVSDVAAAAEAARAAAATARVNLEINLVGIKDPGALAVISDAIESADQVIEQAEALADRVRKQILA